MLYSILAMRLKKLLNKITVVITLLLFCNLISGQDHLLNEKITKIFDHPSCTYANISFCAYDIDQGKKIADYRSKKTLIPASSLKVISTLSALDLFGADYQFETKITHSGVIAKDGTLKGNLYVEGSGDPTLGFNRISGSLDLKTLMKTITDEVIKYGITCIDGKIIADESIFDSYPVSPSWQWDDLGNYYACGAWGINIHENTYYIYFKDRAKVGLRPSINFHEPKIEGIEFSNEVVIDSAGTGDNAYIFGGPYDYYKRISGTIPQGEGNFRIKGAIPDPPLFFAQALQKSLNKANINCLGIETQFRPKSSKSRRKKISSLFSPKLGEIVRLTNEESLNLHAEALFKLSSLKTNSAASGSRAERYIKKKMKSKGIDVAGFHMEDGSGLSTRTTVSAETLAAFVMEQAQDHGPAFISEYLPVVGAEGTVRNLYLSPQLSQKVWLKSGSMKKVLSYTGMMKNKDNEWISVSILFNGFHKKHSDMRKIVAEVLKAVHDKS